MLDFQGNAFRKVREIHLLDAGSAGAKKVCFEDLPKDMLLKVQNKRCSEILCLPGYITYGVHLCNKILICQGTPENGAACHPVFGMTGLEDLLVTTDCFGAALDCPLPRKSKRLLKRPAASLSKAAIRPGSPLPPLLVETWRSKS